MNEIAIGVILSTLLILLLVAGILIAFFVTGRERIRQKQILAEARLDFERELRQVETEISEHILERLARELHDNIGQLLTATHIYLQNQKIDHPALGETLKPAEVYLEEATKELRTLSRTLNHDYISRVGLQEVIHLEVERLNQLRRFTVHWNPFPGILPLDKEQQLVLFRIFQEIVQNALKHSSAKNMFLSVICREQMVELRAEDDGKGFDLKTVLASGKASGLENIRKRARMAGFDCHIHSSPGAGTSFIIHNHPDLL